MLKHARTWAALTLTGGAIIGTALWKVAETPYVDGTALDLEATELRRHEGRHTLWRYIDHEQGAVCYVTTANTISCIPVAGRTDG